MTSDGKCLIQIDGGDGLFFLDGYGSYTQEIQEARIFGSLLDAHEYIDKHGLNKLAIVRRILKSTMD